MKKAADAFRTISEVAEELAVPKHVLRFWEGKFTHIKPMKRGGGRRYYRPEDVDLLRGIRQLLHEEGYTIKGVQKLIRQSGVEFVKGHGKAEPSESAGSATQVAAATPARPPKAGAGSKAKPASRAADTAPLNTPDGISRAVLAELLRDLEACRRLLAGLE